MRKLLFLALFSSSVFADPNCTFNNMIIPTSTISNGAKHALLPRVISPAWHTVSQSNVMMCTQAGANVSFYSLANSLISSTGQNIVFEGENYTIYASGVPGIGVIMAVGDINDKYIPFTSKSTENILWTSNTSIYFPYAGVKAKVRFVETSYLPAGTVTLPALQVMRSGIYISGFNYNGWTQITTAATTITTIYPTCSLKYASTVKLPLMDSSIIQSVGGTARETPFTISLSCGAGAEKINAKFTMTDINSPSNTSSTLTTSATSSASKGIALQVLDAGEVVSFGPDSTAAGNPNQRLFGVIPSAGAVINKSFSVRYLKTDKNVTPGTLNAGVTITMSYQ